MSLWDLVQVASEYERQQASSLNRKDIINKQIIGLTIFSEAER